MKASPSATCWPSRRSVIGERDPIPRTNGKAERFIQTSLREWAYARAYTSSAERTETLKPWLQTYNTERTRGGIRHMTPFAKPNNVLGFDALIHEQLFNRIYPGHQTLFGGITQTQFDPGPVCLQPIGQGVRPDNRDKSRLRAGFGRGRLGGDE